MRIIIDGFVQAQERPRFARRGRGVHTYDPPKSASYKKYVSLIAKRQVKKPFDEAIEVNILVYREPPKSWSKKKKREALEGKVKPETRPDVDNYVKSILDGLNEIAFTDDSLICRLSAEKRYGKKGMAVVEIKPMDPI